MWLVAEPFRAALSDACRLRSRLIPYIYTTALQTYKTGVSLVHPVYFDYPNDNSVYAEGVNTQFMFGDDVFVSPILTKRDSTTNITAHTMYLPEGKWVEMNSLRCLTGGQTVTTGYTMTEMGGAFVKEGSILPMSLEPSRLRDESGEGDLNNAYDELLNAGADGDSSGGKVQADVSTFPPADGRHPILGAAAEIPRTLVWEAYVGNSTTGGGMLMEDDPTTNAYKENDRTTRHAGAGDGDGGNVATTAASFTVAPDGLSLTFDIAAVQGGYKGMAAQRNWEVRLRGAWAPTGVVVTTNSGKRTVVPVAANRRPKRSCGKLLCRSWWGSTAADAATPVASWWWDAATMTAVARVDDVSADVGTTIAFTFGTTLRHGLLHSPNILQSVPVMMGRAVAIKYLVDAELWKGALPSVALNRLVSTADRMQIDPTTAVSELAALVPNLAEVIALHTAEEGDRLPSKEVQAVLSAWLS